MSIIYLLLMVSIVVAIVFFAAFIISVKKGQYDDVYTPSVRMLFEDEIVQEEDVQLADNINATIEVSTSEKQKQNHSTKKN